MPEFFSNVWPFWEHVSSQKLSYYLPYLSITYEMTSDSLIPFVILLVKFYKKWKTRGKSPLGYSIQAIDIADPR